MFMSFMFSSVFTCALNLYNIWLQSNYCRWEWIISLGFEWDFITGKRRLRWPMVRFVPQGTLKCTEDIHTQLLYFANRYVCLVFMIAVYAIPDAWMRSIGLI